MTKVVEVYDFIDSAIKSRKYPENTGLALKTALKLFEVELSNEEKESIDLFKSNLDRIYNEVFQKNKSRFSVDSLATYKSRVNKAIGDFEKYGLDPSKMANWQPKTISRGKRSPKKAEETILPPSASMPEIPALESRINFNRVQITLKDNTRATIEIPVTASSLEVKKIITILSSLYEITD